jgi:hypothetical protein
MRGTEQKVLHVRVGQDVPDTRVAGTAIVPFEVAVSTPSYLLKAVKTRRAVIYNVCDFTTFLLK